MPTPTETATVRLTNEKVRFEGIAPDHPDLPITMDYVPPLGDGSGHTGLGLLLIAFAGCSATAVVALLRRMQRSVGGFEVRASGTRREKPPIAFERIDIEFVVASPDAEDADVRRAIALAEEAWCPVWQMIKGNVEVSARYRIAERLDD